MTKPEIDEGLLPCPFCGATPHRGLTKMQHDQLHGEPFQRYRVWCPHGCANIDQMNEAAAISAWNRRASTRASEAAEPDFWAVHSSTGAHIGLWPAKVDAEAVVRGGTGYTITPLYAAPHPSPVSEEGTAKPVGMRVCPERDSLCPHGHDCAFSIDRYHCNMVGSRDALASIWSTKP